MIIISKSNDDKDFAKDRNENHPKGRDMPNFEIRQILMGDSEVFTNLTFIKLFTLPFESRPKNSIRPDDTTQNPSDTFLPNIPLPKVIIEKDFLAYK